MTKIIPVICNFLQSHQPVFHSFHEFNFSTYRGMYNSSTQDFLASFGVKILKFGLTKSIQKILGR